MYFHDLVSQSLLLQHQQNTILMAAFDTIDIALQYSVKYEVTLPHKTKTLLDNICKSLNCFLENQLIPLPMFYKGYFTKSLCCL